MTKEQTIKELEQSLTQGRQTREEIARQLKAYDTSIEVMESTLRILKGEEIIYVPYGCDVNTPYQAYGLEGTRWYWESNDHPATVTVMEVELAAARAKETKSTSN